MAAFVCRRVWAWVWAFVRAWVVEFKPRGRRPWARVGAHLLLCLLVLTGAVPGRPGEPAPSLAAAPAEAVVKPQNLTFGVYAGGGTGEMAATTRPDETVLLDRLGELRRAAGRDPFTVYVFTSWRDYDPAALGRDLDRYASAGLRVTLTVRFRPPVGREGDSAGFVGLVRRVVERHGAHPALERLVIGNELNATENSGASDGAFPAARPAVIAGVLAARASLDRLNPRVALGINFSTNDRDANGAFLRQLVESGGPEFRAAIAFVGINVYPGIWTPGFDDPYWDMFRAMNNARGALIYAGFPDSVSLDILENGHPNPDEAAQATRLTAFVSAVLDYGAGFGVTHYSWFSLWDADSGAASRFGHYGLLRSDLSPKPAFNRYRDLIGGAAG